MRLLRLLLKISINLVLAIFCICSIIFMSFLLTGPTYLNSSTPIGGDYFNFLTYADFFKKYLPFPPTGWVPFYNQGQPVIGGYPWLGYYLMLPFTQGIDTSTGLNYFGLTFHILFFVSCLLVFAYTSRSWLLGLAMALLVLITPASHQQLFAGGFVIAASAQFYLPLTWLFASLYLRTKSSVWLIPAGLVTGLALAHHAPTNLIILFAPLVLTLLIHNKKNFLPTILFVGISVGIGLSGIYSTLLQNYLGSGKSACANPECWGNYPRHFNSWLNYPVLTTIAVLIILLPWFKFFKKKLSLSTSFPFLIGLSIHLLYGLLAYAHLINGQVNVIFPIRLFWSALVYFILISSQLFGEFKKNFPWFAQVIPLAVLIFVCTTFLTPLPKFYHDSPNTYPQLAYKYVIPKYTTNSLSEIVPTWLTQSSSDWRLDSINSGIVQWWNFVSPIPSLRGYSNHPLGEHASWQYFLQSATRNVTINKNLDLHLNQMHFLLDHFGVGYIDGTTADYPSQFLTSKDYITTTTASSDFGWYQLNPTLFSPILSATNATPVLFVGDYIAYKIFVRALSLTTYSSQFLVPVQGPESIDRLTKTHFATFPAMFIYNYSGSNWTPISNYIKNGGFVFLDTSSQTLPSRLPDMFPLTKLTPTQIHGDFVTGFQNLNFEGGPWKLYLGTNLKPWAKPLLSSAADKIYISGGQYGTGQIVLSTFNFPYHIMQTSGPQEVQLFTQLLAPLVPQVLHPQTSVSRPQPNHIIVTGNFKGIYFKENFDTGWQAKSSNQTLRIYQAGPDFMYIPLPKSTTQRVDLRFVGNFGHWTVFIISLLGLLSTLPLLYYSQQTRV